MIKNSKFKKVVFFLIIFASFNNFAYASESVGGIDENSYLTKLCQNSDCSLFQIVNFRPTNGNPVVITDQAITGDIWFETSGWVTLNPVNGGVSNTENGVLGGLGWGQIASWVNFSPSNGGVSINDQGEFFGWAWVSGGYGGWVKFDCSDTSTCIKTDWRPISVRSTVESGGGSSSSQNQSGSISNGSPFVERVNLNSTSTNATSGQQMINTNLTVTSTNITEVFTEIYKDILVLKNELKAEIVDYSKTIIRKDGQISGNTSENSEIITKSANTDIESSDPDNSKKPGEENNKFVVYLLIIGVLLLILTRSNFLRKSNSNQNK